MDPRIRQLRAFLKDTIRQEVDFRSTDQSRGIAPPPVSRPASPDQPRVKLAEPGAWQGVGTVDLATAIGRRRSRRDFSGEPLALDELSFLLWATQGVTRSLGPGHALRTVPSAGCRHALETYVGTLAVTGVEEGLYRYLPLEHALVLERRVEHLGRRLALAALGQRFVAAAAAVVVWTAVPYRMEWRYGLAAHKVIALDAGHVGQNLYLACEAVGCGTCAIAAYDQAAMDALLGVDGDDELTVYLAPVGKRPVV